jgi:PglZ domain
MHLGVATTYLFQLIAKQVDDRRLVVWFDPEREYSGAVANLDLTDTTVACYTDCFFTLRKEIDPLLNDQQPPRLVVYIPMDATEAHHALVELEAAGVVIQPGQQPPNRNTRLAVIARNALRPIVGDETAAEIEKQVENGKLSLADLDKLADKGKGISTAVLTLIFGNANPQDVALAFLTSDKHDPEIEKKTATKELLGLLQNAYDFEFPAKTTLAEARGRLARHVLLTDLNVGLGETLPSSLGSVAVATSPTGRDLCQTVARNWRLRRDVRDSYVAAAKKVEQEFSLGTLQFQPDKLGDLETFLACERALIRHVEQELLSQPKADFLTLAESRLSKFWAEVLPGIQARWALIAAAAEVLLEADRVAKSLKKPPATIPLLIEAYAEGESPWCLLDTHHRHMETRRFNFEPVTGDEERSLDMLIVKARQRYTEVGSQLAKHFVTQFGNASHPIKGVLRQRDTFDKQVKAKLAENKVAYVWVDALRYEMARELCRLLTDDFDLSIHPAIGTVPTITEIGMAALLPLANHSAKVVAVGGGKLGLEIDGTILKDRKDRIAFLKAHAGVQVFDTKLEELFPKPQKKVKEGIQSAGLVLVTSQEIDELCEADNIAQARFQMDGVLGHLRRGVRVLSDLGIKTIVLAADHGHLFADELGEDMKIEAPGGQTEDLHRRLWVGIGGNTEPSYLRMPLKSLGVDSDLDLATPWTFAGFKSKGGARAYFHGGLSLQELIVPVVVMTTKSVALSCPSTGIQWKLTPGSAKLTTRFFSIQVSGSQSQSSLFGLEPPKVRVEIRANKKCICVPVSASYGFEDATGEVALKPMRTDPRKIEPNTVTVMLAEEPAQKTVGIWLLDATTGVELASLDKIEVAISM